MTTNTFGKPVYVYSLKEAVDDGILVQVGSFANGLPIIFTTNLFEERTKTYQDLIHKGIELLKQLDNEDSPNMKLRVIEKGKVWVILNAESCTFMKPEDY